MASPSLSRRHSIGAKIFGAFIAMGLITGALGVYGLYVLTAAGRIVTETYDGPLMAINFARSASLTFSLMDKEALRRSTLIDDGHRRKVDEAIETLATSFYEDLAVVEKRAATDRQKATIVEIRNLVDSWLADLRSFHGAAASDDLDVIATRIIDRFDVLIELTAGHSFVERRKAVWSISYFTYTSIAVSVLALILSAVITLVLARRIIRPLAAAATVANRIAGGELQTEIPQGGKDETGLLLRSMTVMQDNIRAMMEREMAERRSAQRRLIDAVEGSREGMVLVDATGKIVIANQQFATFFSAAAIHMIQGANFEEAFLEIRPMLAWPADLDDEARAVVEHGPTHDDFSVGEYETTDNRWVRFSKSRTQDGGFFLFLSDFTEIKMREEHFRQAKLAADVASNAKSNFLANMSHELRTPLNAIIGFSDIIAKQRFGIVGNVRYVGYAVDIQQSGSHLLEIINSILDLTKSEAGRLEIKLEAVDLCQIVDDCETMIRVQCTEAELWFEVERPNHALMVEGDRAKLRQIVLNLLSNAVKFTQRGGIISLKAQAVADTVEIQVVDTGIGMTPEDLKIAMTPFGQVDSALSRRYEGTGLGLPLTAALIELHAGKLQFDSEPDKGTRVTVTFPQMAAQVTPQADALPPPRLAI